MISKINGSTQMPAQIQHETEAGQTNTKKSDMNGPMAGSNDQPRTAPAVQPRNPAAEMKYEAHRMAADLNAQLNSTNGGQPKPPEPNAIELEDLLLSHVKAPDRAPVGEEGPKPGGKASNYQWMVSGFKSDPPKNPEGSENKSAFPVRDTKL